MAFNELFWPTKDNPYELLTNNAEDSYTLHWNILFKNDRIKRFTVSNIVDSRDVTGGQKKTKKKTKQKKDTPLVEKSLHQKKWKVL